MDVNDIKKVANRKRIITEAENLQQRFIRETKNVIKSKVAQDTAYWDLKEKYQDLEVRHGRLQQNMLEVQMQLENVSGQLQEELRMRPETMNKLTSTRNICDVLESYCASLKQTLSQCQASQQELCDAFQQSRHVVAELKRELATQQAQSQAAHAQAEETLKAVKEQHEYVVAVLNSALRRRDEEVAEMKSRLAALKAQRAELAACRDELNATLHQVQLELEMKTKALSEMKQEKADMLNDFKRQASEANDFMQKQKTEFKEKEKESETLQRALQNQEEYLKSVTEKNEAMQDKISQLEEELEKLAEKTNSDALASASAQNILRENVKKLEQEINALENLNNEKSLLLESQAEASAKEVEALTLQLQTLQVEKEAIAAELASSRTACADERQKVEALTTELTTFEAKHAALEKSFQEYKTETEADLESQEAENKSKSESITRLMTDIKVCVEDNDRLEKGLARCRREMDTEKDRASERERQLNTAIEGLKETVKVKEEEYAKQMANIQQLRREKEKQYEEIVDLKTTIDNAQKQLTNPSLLPKKTVSHPPPEHDDNAVSFVPRMSLQARSDSPTFPAPSPFSRRQKRVQFATAPSQSTAAPTKAKPSKDFAFSDSSMEDSFDQTDVRRKFEAIMSGPPLSPKPVPRKRPAAAQSQPTRNNTGNKSIVEINQKKKFFKTKKALESKTQE